MWGADLQQLICVHVTLFYLLSLLETQCYSALRGLLTCLCSLSVCLTAKPIAQ